MFYEIQAIIFWEGRITYIKLSFLHALFNLISWKVFKEKWGSYLKVARNMLTTEHWRRNSRIKGNAFFFRHWNSPKSCQHFEGEVEYGRGSTGGVAGVQGKTPSGVLGKGMKRVGFDIGCFNIITFPGELLANNFFIFLFLKLWQKMFKTVKKRTHLPL